MSIMIEKRDEDENEHTKNWMLEKSNQATFKLSKFRRFAIKFAIVTEAFALGTQT